MAQGFKCKSCGEMHQSTICTKFVRAPLDTPRDHARKGGEVMQAATSGGEGGRGARSSVAASVDPVTKGRQAKGKSSKSGAPFDRIAYQREYMRKRRAEAKARKLAEGAIA